MRPGIEPSEATAQRLNAELARLEEGLVHTRDLQLAACRGLDPSGHVDDLIRVEVEADYGVVALGLGGLLLDGDAAPLGVELRHPIALGVTDPVAEDRRPALALGTRHGLLQQLREAHTVEYIIPQHEAGAVVADEVAPYDEGLS